MPVHNWSRVDAGLFHAFHQQWTITLCNALNSGVLPTDYFALPEQSIKGPIPDVLTLKLASEGQGPDHSSGGLTVAVAPPRTRIVRRHEADIYAEKANRVTIRHRHGEIVASIEIISPGNKASQADMLALVDKSVELLRQGVHLLMVDLFPPGKRDPKGLHKAIWDHFEDEDFEPPADKPFLLASYDAGPSCFAYVEPVGPGDELPPMPLFLKPGIYVPAPLEETYQTSWALFPAPLKKLLAD